MTKKKTNVKQAKLAKPTRARTRKTMPKPGWLECLASPFSHRSIQIPDDATTASGVITSKFYTRIAPAAIQGTSTSHNFGVMIHPFPQGGIVQLHEANAGSGNLRDLNLAGTTLISRTNWPNVASIANGGYNARLVSLGVRMTYEGTELNRSGRIFGGTIPILYNAQSSVGTKLSAASTLINVVEQDAGLFLLNMSNRTESRTSDSTYEIHWVPSGSPTYQKMNNDTTEMLDQDASTPGADRETSYWNAPIGDGGAQMGQNALVVIVEADTTSAAQDTPNVYALECIAHWEVVPSSSYGVVYDVNPSMYNVSELARALNFIGSISSGGVSQATSVLNTTAGNREFSGYSDYLTMENMQKVIGTANSFYKLFAKPNARAQPQQNLLGWR